jgi:hypothetical protein
MQEPYTKLACSILDSSVWDNDDATVRIWVTILAMKDKDGVIHTSLSGLARRARKTIDETRAAIAKFEEPDPDSRNPENEGRRIRRITGGWQVLNHEWYRNALQPEDQREYERQRKAKQRANKKSGMSGTNGTSGTNGENVGMSAHQSRAEQSRAEQGVPFDVAAELPEPLWPKTADALIASARDEIKRLKGDDANWESALAADTQQSVDWLLANKPDGWEERVKAMKENRINYVRSKLTAVAQEKVRLLNERIAAIKKKMSGIVPP